MIADWLQALWRGENRIIRSQAQGQIQLERAARERREILDATQANYVLLGKVLRQVEQIGQTMATQADIDALTGRVTAVNDAVTTGVAGIRSDLADLKTANPTVDTTALEASVGALETDVSGLTELDGENPPAPDGSNPTPAAGSTGTIGG